MDLFPSLGSAIFISVFGLIVLAVVTGARREIDLTGSRARALYLYAVAFVSLVIAVFAISAVVAAIVRIILPSHVPSIPGFDSISGTSDKEFTNEAVLGALIAIAALLIFRFHYRRIEEVLREPGWLDTPGARVRRGYIYLASFVWILIALFAGVGAAFGLYQIILPGTAGLGAPSDTVRDSGIVALISLGLLAAAAGVIFRAHWRRLSGIGPPVQGAVGGTPPAAMPPPGRAPAPPPPLSE
jgi:hypothetical protein